VEPVINDLLSPWRTNRLPRAIGLLATDLVLPWIPFALTIALVATSLGLAVTYPLATPFIGLLFVVAAAFGKLERSRVHAHTGADIGDPGHPRTTGSWWHRIRTLLASKSRWKEVAYFLTTPIWATALGVFTFCLWGASIFLVTLPVVAGRFPSGSAELGLFNVGPGLSAFAAGALGLVCLVVVAPWCTLGFAAARREVAAALLGPGQDEALRRRVRSLETSRSAAVDAAEKERRRIERDLHDGAQQRLVALAMDLGRAKERFETDPDGARQIIESAHDEAKAALSELRDLVRGIHPAILADRGLDAALSAVVARCPVPISLHVAVADRPPAAVESAAYFVVTEALMNAVRHADAGRVRIDIARHGDRLVLEVHDDGRGGADPSRGTGLRGLEERVAALGGWMQVLSPAGGPTSVLVELPCGS